jgi:hypothetical protein
MPVLPNALMALLQRKRAARRSACGDEPGAALLSADIDETAPPLEFRLTHERTSMPSPQAVPVG